VHKGITYRKEALDVYRVTYNKERQKYPEIFAGTKTLTTTPRRYMQTQQHHTVIQLIVWHVNFLEKPRFLILKYLLDSTLLGCYAV
jgi:hypothetical protein